MKKAGESQHLRYWDDKRKLDPDVWYYREPQGLCIVAHAGPGVVRMSYLSWDEMRKLLAEHDALELIK